MTTPTHYEFGAFLAALQRLGVQPSASRLVSRRAVQGAYRDLVRRHHPDQFQHSSQQRQATAELQDVNSARDYVMQHFASFVWPPPKWTRAMCVAACAEYAHAWPLDPRD